ncbi:MAG: polysaccharide biosynthesis protein [Rhodobacterales bacterium]|nr:MAG: polysaccharide biosynthesis protein [Rhodobacterales bacterium]
MARVVRSSAFVMFGYGANQVLRLASNLILTRLLFPEAFGLMALVTMVEIGLKLFTDLGIGPSIAQSKRGDDPAFLDTAYTIKVIRGFLLWIATCLIAYPASVFYDAPELVYLLPVATFSMVISGFTTVRVETAYRHLQLGKVTAIEVVSYTVSIVVMVALAWEMGTVLSLALGGPVKAAVQCLLAKYYLDGHRNRLYWDRSAVNELLHFGKWIFGSTLFSFFASQGDKMVFGRFLSLHVLGIYNIGYYLGSFPAILGQELVGRVMIPIYREVQEKGTRETSRKLRMMRYLLTGGLIALMGTLSVVGPALVEFLYDDRYIHAGGMLVLIALAMMPAAIGVSYDRAALAAGDSRHFFVVSAVRGTTSVLFLLIGVYHWGITGAIAGIALSGIAVHPFLIWLSIRHKVWDPEHDAVFFLIAAALAVGSIWLHQDAIMAMSLAAAEG